MFSRWNHIRQRPRSTVSRLIWPFLSNMRYVSFCALCITDEYLVLRHIWRRSLTSRKLRWETISRQQMILRKELEPFRIGDLDKWKDSFATTEDAKFRATSLTTLREKRSLGVGFRTDKGAGLSNFPPNDGLKACTSFILLSYFRSCCSLV